MIICKQATSLNNPKSKMKHFDPEYASLNNFKETLILKKKFQGQKENYAVKNSILLKDTHIKKDEILNSKNLSIKITTNLPTFKELALKAPALTKMETKKTSRQQLRNHTSSVYLSTQKPLKIKTAKPTKQTVKQEDETATKKTSAHKKMKKKTSKMSTKKTKAHTMKKKTKSNKVTTQSKKHLTSHKKTTKVTTPKFKRTKTTHKKPPKKSTHKKNQKNLPTKKGKKLEAPPKQPN